MSSRHERMRSEEIVPLVRRLLEGEPDFIAKPRGGGLCCYCRGGLGHDEAPPRLFAVIADGGVLLRLDEDRRERVVARGVAVPNAALPRWVLEPVGKPATERPARQDADLHGLPQEWVWVPIVDVEAFERRRGHLLEALAYGRFLAARGEGRAESVE